MKKSRREFFKYMSVLSISSFYVTPLYSKTFKEIVKYQDTPKDGKKCEECLHFVAATNECKTVAGNIDPNGWCSIYYKDPSYKD